MQRHRLTYEEALVELWVMAAPRLGACLRRKDAPAWLIELVELPVQAAGRGRLENHSPRDDEPVNEF